MLKTTMLEATAKPASNQPRQKTKSKEKLDKNTLAV
jgi:hypothetical protein